MARFDEEANINWAAAPGGGRRARGLRRGRPQDPRQDGAGGAARGSGRAQALRRYVHLGTGNYHPRTARLYTDFGLLTANEEICADVNEVFKQLTGLGKRRPS